MCIVFPFLVFFRFSQNDFTQLPELVRWAPTGLRSLLHHDIYMYHVWGRRKQCAKMLRPSPQKFSVMALYIVWLLYLLGLWPVAKYIATSMYYQNNIYMYLLRVELHSVVQEIDNLCFLKILWFGRLGRLGFGIITNLHSTLSGRWNLLLMRHVKQ